MFVGVRSFSQAASSPITTSFYWRLINKKWGWRGHCTKVPVPDELCPLGAGKDSHGHCFSFNVQTASMFYVKRSWQPTLFLYLFIIQEEQWRNKKRSVKVKHGPVFTPGLLSGPKCCFVVLQCWLLHCQYSLLNCTHVRSWRSFLLIEAENWLGCRGVSEVVGFHLRDPQQGCLISDEAADDCGQALLIEIIHIWYYIHTCTLSEEESAEIYTASTPVIVRVQVHCCAHAHRTTHLCWIQMEFIALAESWN